VLVKRPFGDELPGGFRQSLAESAVGVAARRLAVAVCNRLTGADSRRLALVLLSCECSVRLPLASKSESHCD
jgi:hypothetical protein